MIIMIAAAITAAAPAQPAQPHAQQHEMTQHQQMQHQQMQHQQGAQHQQHKGMDCCEECCKDMAEHKGDGPEHSKHSH